MTVFICLIIFNKLLVWLDMNLLIWCHGLPMRVDSISLKMITISSDSCIAYRVIGTLCHQQCGQTSLNIIFIYFLSMKGAAFLSSVFCCFLCCCLLVCLGCPLQIRYTELFEIICDDLTCYFIGFHLYRSYFLQHYIVLEYFTIWYGWCFLPFCISEFKLHWQHKKDIVFFHTKYYIYNHICLIPSKQLLCILNCNLEVI